MPSHIDVSDLQDQDPATSGCSRYGGGRTSPDQLGDGWNPTSLSANKRITDDLWSEVEEASAGDRAGSAVRLPDAAAVLGSMWADEPAPVSKVKPTPRTALEREVAEEMADPMTTHL